MTRAVFTAESISLDPGVLPLANVTLQVGSLRRFSFMNFACALIRGALQVGYTDLSFSRKTSLYFIMPIPFTARISISDPALLPICHLQKVRCEPGLAYYNETTTSLNSDSSICGNRPIPCSPSQLPSSLCLPSLPTLCLIASSGGVSTWTDKGFLFDFHRPSFSIVRI